MNLSNPVITLTRKDLIEIAKYAGITDAVIADGGLFGLDTEYTIYKNPGKEDFGGVTYRYAMHCIYNQGKVIPINEQLSEEEVEKGFDLIGEFVSNRDILTAQLKEIKNQTKKILLIKEQFSDLEYANRESSRLANLAISNDGNTVTPILCDGLVCDDPTYKAGYGVDIPSHLFGKPDDQISKHFADQIQNQKEQKIKKEEKFKAEELEKAINLIVSSGYKISKID